MSHIAKDGPIVARNEDQHLHAFVFIDHSDKKIAKVLSNLEEFRRSEFPRVWWAGSVVGDYLALVHVEVEDQNDLDGMQTFLETDLWNAGVHCMKSTEVAVINKVGAKHETPDILSLIGIKAEHGQARSVADQLAQKDFESGFELFKGASVVTGHLDILLQVNTSSFVAARDRLFPVGSEGGGVLDGIEGIAWTSTAVTDGSRGPFAVPLPLPGSESKSKIPTPRSKSKS